MRQLNFEAEPFGSRHNQGAQWEGQVGKVSGSGFHNAPKVFNVGAVAPPFKPTLVAHVSPPVFTPNHTVVSSGGHPYYMAASSGGNPWSGHSYGHQGRWGWLHRWNPSYGGFGQTGQSSDIVLNAQACLAQIVGNVPQDGIMGPATRRAIQVFQQQAQLPPTGMLDQTTLTALQQVCSAPQGQPGGGGGAPPSQAPPA